jgi:hypothetical protein
MRSRIEPVMYFARTVRTHRELLLNYFKAKKQFSSGVIGPDLFLEPLPRRILKLGKPREVGLQGLLHPFHRGLTQCQPFGPFQ